MAELTQDRLKSLYHYDPCTGDFVRTASAMGAKIGRVMKAKNWKGYLTLHIDGRKYRQHRLAWLYVNGEWPKGDIDHINHDKTDNRISNLRVVDNATNHKNVKMQSNNKSGVTGVSWEKRRNTWCARIKDGNKYRHIGYFDSIFDAVCARKSAENILGYHMNHGK